MPPELVKLPFTCTPENSPMFIVPALLESALAMIMSPTPESEPMLSDPEWLMVSAPAIFIVRLLPTLSARIELPLAPPSVSELMLELVSQVTLSLPVLMTTSLVWTGRPLLHWPELLQLPLPPSQLSGEEGEDRKTGK